MIIKQYKLLLVLKSWLKLCKKVVNEPVQKGIAYAD